MCLGCHDNSLELTMGRVGGTRGCWHCLWRYVWDNMQIRELGWVVCVEIELPQDGVTH